MRKKKRKKDTIKSNKKIEIYDYEECEFNLFNLFNFLPFFILFRLLTVSSSLFFWFILCFLNLLNYRI